MHAPYCLLTHDATLGILQEVDDVLNLRTVRNLVLDLLNHVEHARLSVEEQTIGVGDMTLNLLIDLGIVHHRRVRTTIFHRVTTSNNIGGNIVRKGSTSLDQREVTSTGIGILNGSTGEDNTIADLAVAGNLRAIAENTVVSNHRVVADMGTL